MADQSLAVLSQALKLEQDGYAFYVKAAEQTADPKGKAMFLSLADDETKHADMIQLQLHALEGDGKYVLLPDLDVAAIDAEAPVFAQGKLEGATGELQALYIALENEIESFNLYRKAAQETADPWGKQMFRWLAAAERSHFDMLMLNYESISDSGGWV